MEFGETREHEMRPRREIESLTAEILALRAATLGDKGPSLAPLDTE